MLFLRYAFLALLLFPTSDRPTLVDVTAVDGAAGLTVTGVAIGDISENYLLSVSMNLNHIPTVAGEGAGPSSPPPTGSPKKPKPTNADALNAQDVHEYFDFCPQTFMVLWEHIKVKDSVRPIAKNGLITLFLSLRSEGWNDSHPVLVCLNDNTFTPLLGCVLNNQDDRRRVLEQAYKEPFTNFTIKADGTTPYLYCFFLSCEKRIPRIVSLSFHAFVEFKQPYFRRSYFFLQTFGEWRSKKTLTATGRQNPKS